jgi:hypothetical protein
MHWQMTSVTHATIATQIHQAFDVHRRFSTQVTLDIEFAYLGADRV